MNHEHEHHGGPANPPNSAPPLLDKPTVTIYFDGLIFSAFNDDENLYQTAVLTQAEGHELVLEVRVKGDNKLIFPTAELPWDKSHPVVKKLAPFWMYVDSGNGINKEEFSARLHLPPPEAKDPQSFDRIFNFEAEHDHPFKPKPETFALFNFPQGTSYSALNVNAKLKTVAQGAPATSAVDVRNIDVSTLGAIDIDAVSDDASEKHIVLVNEEGHEFFRFPLQPDKHYEIQVLNVPIDAHEHGGAAQHFLQFYELFDLKNDEKEFLVALPPPPTSLSPPCVTTTGRPKSGI
jgi:hypothetical protein